MGNLSENCHSPAALSSFETSWQFGGIIFPGGADSPPSMSWIGSMDHHPSSALWARNAARSAVVPDFAGGLATVCRDTWQFTVDAPSEPLIITPQVAVTSDGELSSLEKRSEH